jgi:hypothetical protein
MSPVEYAAHLRQQSRTTTSDIWDALTLQRALIAVRRAIAQDYRLTCTQARMRLHEARRSLGVVVAV